MAFISDYGRPAWRLFEKACDALRYAYAPNSKVKIGVAAYIEGNPGISPKMVWGFNAERRRYNDGIHGEESLTDAALRSYEPRHRPVRFFRDLIVIVSNMDSPIPPCGACRDVLLQHSRLNTKVIMANQNGYAMDSTVSRLLPDAKYLLEEQLATECGVNEVRLEPPLSLEKEGRGEESAEEWDFLSMQVANAWDVLSRQKTLCRDPKAYAALGSFSHTDFQGGTVSQPAFHGFQALELAAARTVDASSGTDHEVFPIDIALYVADAKGFVLPSGRERQWLFDLGKRGEKPVQVYCVSRDKALMTTSEDLLPGAFSLEGIGEK